MEKCQLPKLDSLESWVEKGETNDNCPPCLLKPLASWYLDALQENKETDMANELQSVFESGDILTIAKTMDIIKNRAENELREKLLNFDCMAQSFKMHE